MKVKNLSYECYILFFFFLSFIWFLLVFKLFDYFTYLLISVILLPKKVNHNLFFQGFDMFMRHMHFFFKIYIQARTFYNSLLY